MAIILTTVAGQANSSRQVGFMIASVADVTDLPTTTTPGAYGRTVDEMSYAVTNDGRIFVLGTDDVWHEW